jgi:hypothetical protein
MGVVMKYVKFFILNIVVFSTLFLIISLLLPTNIGTRTDFTIADVANDSLQQKIKNTMQWCLLAPNLKNVIAQNDSIIHITHQATNGTEYQSIFTFFKQDSGKISWTMQQRLEWYKPFAKFAAMVGEKNTATIMDSCVRRLLQKTN